jgi:hypothetical protein
MSAEWATVYAKAATAAATFFAVVVALFVAGADARRRSKEREVQQAEQISAWMEYLPLREERKSDEPTVRLVVQNASDQLVYSLVATVVTSQGETKYGNEYEFRNWIGRVPPGRREYKIKHPGGVMGRRFAIELAFQDAGNRVWIRHGRGLLERAPKGKDPVTAYGLSHPVSWLMP